MITLIKLKKSINDILKSFNIKTYGNEIIEGFIRPCFFTQILPISGVDLYKTDLTQNSYTVEINYFSENKTDLENLKVAEALREKIFPVINIENRNLTVKEFRSEINDGVLSTRFNLNWFENIPKKEVEEKITKLKIRMEE